jgi:Uma2 family endonuclease
MRYASRSPMSIRAPEPNRHKFTRDDVERMLAAGILEARAGVELLEGDLVVMSPQNPEHSGLADVLRARVEAALGSGFYARTHAPVDAGLYSQPEPDVALLRGRPEDFVTRQPAAEDTLLVIEIARSSLPRDRRKARIYATGGFAEYWLFDLERQEVHVHRHPESSGEYSQVDTLHADGVLTVPGATVGLPLAPLFDLLNA